MRVRVSLVTLTVLLAISSMVRFFSLSLALPLSLSRFRVSREAKQNADILSLANMQARNAVKGGKGANESPLTQLTREWQVRFHRTQTHSVRTVLSLSLSLSLSLCPSFALCILCRNDSQSLFLPFSGRLANSHTTALWPLSLFRFR